MAKRFARSTVVAYSTKKTPLYQYYRPPLVDNCWTLSPELRSLRVSKTVVFEIPPRRQAASGTIDTSTRPALGKIGDARAVEPLGRRAGEAEEDFFRQPVTSQATAGKINHGG
jgi:hypothetical protein